MRDDIEHWNRTHPDEAPIDVEEHTKEAARLLADIDEKLGL